MSMFRSDRMGYYNLLMPREYAWEVLNELGDLGCLQFVDQNAHEAGFNRPYSNYIKRCEDLEAKIQSIEHEMKRFDLSIQTCDDPKVFLYDLKTFLLSRTKAERTYFDDLETFIDERSISIVDQIKNYDSLIENYNHLIEWRQVLLQTRSYIGDNEFRAQYVGEGVNIEESSLARGGIRFSYLAGVINREDSLRFKKILFRVTRGMAWTALLDISKPKPNSEGATYFLEQSSTETKEKTVFLIVYQGGSFDMMKAKLNKICEAFGASKYGIPEDPQAFNKKLQDLEGEIREAQNVLNITQGVIKNMLDYFAQPRTQTIAYSLIEDIRLFLIKEKAIYHNLNTLKTQSVLYQGSCWCPMEISDKVRQAITELKRRKPEIGGCDFKEAPFPIHVAPPTHYRLNEFTSVFQQIVDTYGVPRYREINPALFNIATFPFLFGVMFGDIGHGGLLMVFGVYLCFWKESIEKDRKSMLAGLLPFRYLLLMQGFFAFYCGLIYNDFMAMPFNLFGSCYNGEGLHEGDPVPKISDDCVYPIGIDPEWYGSSNELTFLNSFKMKISIIFGVAQMLFGIILRGCNNFHFNQWLELVFEFIPMLIFLSFTFGYMAILILLKWATPWGTEEHPTSGAPSIISIFIKMALEPGKWSSDLGDPLYGDSQGTYQAELQLALFLTSGICAFLILFPKPLILWMKHACGGGRNQAEGHALIDEPNMKERLLENIEEGEKHEEAGSNMAASQAPVAHGGHSGHGHGHGHGFDFGEIFVHQVIETIEFVLGSISNTASYLRLWALSLAHSQLAKVFFDNTMGSAIQTGNFITAFFGFIFFAIVTLGVLLLMDQLECFLHALRLHWVEFQNKFFKADGYAFNPLSFEKTLRAASE